MVIKGSWGKNVSGGRGKNKEREKIALGTLGGKSLDVGKAKDEF